MPIDDRGPGRERAGLVFGPEPRATSVITSATTRQWSRTIAPSSPRPSGIDPDRWVWLRQVHGAAVHVATVPPGRHPGPAPEADAVVTDVPGLATRGRHGRLCPARRRLRRRGRRRACRSPRSRRRSDRGRDRATPGDRNRRRARVPRSVHPGGVLRVRSATTSTVSSRSSARGVSGRTRAGRPALDIPAAIRVVLDREGVVVFDDCGVCTADSARSLLVSQARGFGTPSDGRGDAVSDRRTADRGARADRERGARIRTRRRRGDARRRDQGSRPRRRARGNASRARSTSGRTAPRTSPRRPTALAADEDDGSIAAPRWHFIGRLQRNKVRTIASPRRAVGVDRSGRARGGGRRAVRRAPRCSCRSM